MRRAVAFGLALSFISISASAEPESAGAGRPRAWYLPAQARAQTGGFYGRFTGGLAYAPFSGHLEIAAMYGYTARNVGPDVHSVVLEVSARPLLVRFGPSLRVAPLYGGLGLLGSLTHGYWYSLPDRYERGYYARTAIHPVAHLGVSADWHGGNDGWFRAHGIYGEVVTTWRLLRPYVRNTHTVDVTEVLATAVGYRMLFW
jgi:hypothetical protein